MKKLCFVLMVLLSVSNGMAFAQDEDGLDEATMAKQFHEFNARTNHVTGDMAYYSLVAFSIDAEETLATLKAWPKIEIQALSLLLDLGFENSMYGPDYDAQPMAFLRLSRNFTSTVKDMAGLADYSEVIVGKLGESTQERFGVADPGSSVFYPEGGAVPRIVRFSHETIIPDWNDLYACNDMQLRLHMKDEHSVGKVEYLSECVARPK